MKTKNLIYSITIVAIALWFQPFYVAGDMYQTGHLIGALGYGLLAIPLLLAYSSVRSHNKAFTAGLSLYWAMVIFLFGRVGLQHFGFNINPEYIVSPGTGLIGSLLVAIGFTFALLINKKAEEQSQ